MISERNDDILTRSMKKRLERKRNLSKEEKELLENFYKIEKSLINKKKKINTDILYDDILSSDMDIFSDEEDYKYFKNCKIDCDSDSDSDSDFNLDDYNDIKEYNNENEKKINIDNKLLENIIKIKLKESIKKAIKIRLNKEEEKRKKLEVIIEEEEMEEMEEIEENEELYEISKELKLDGIEKLCKKDIQKILSINKEIIKINNETIPSRLKILLSELPIKTKAIIIKKLELLNTLDNSSSEYKKLSEWIDNVLKIPFGIKRDLPIKKEDGKEKISIFLHEFKNKLDKAIYGQNKLKETLIELVAKWITHPPSKGHAIAIVGVPGCGKTSIFREGVSKGLDRPFCSFSLAGMSDESYLSGFSLTYEGSDFGKITRMLIEAGTMNPIIFMDEVDKIDKSHNGISVMNKLIEITDFSQNYEYEDLYFSGIKIDLSQCLFIFSLNDINLIDPVLRDRLEIIHVNGFNINEKIIICRDYIIPRELKDFNIKEENLIFTDEIIKYIISKIKNEEGVRELKRAINIIIRKINVLQYNISKDIVSYNQNIKFPLYINTNIVDNLLKLEKNNDLPPFGMYN